MAECFEEGGSTNCPLVGNCSLNSALSEAVEAFFSVLRQHSILDIVASQPEISPLLGIKTAGLHVQH